MTSNLEKDIFLVSPSFFFNTRLTFKTVAAFVGISSEAR